MQENSLQPYRNNRRVVAADDDPLVIRMYRKVLGSEGRDDRQQVTGAVEDLLATWPEQLATTGEPQQGEVEEREPFQLDTFSQGEALVDGVRRAIDQGRPYVAALIDIRMPPGIDGLEAARRIRALDQEITLLIISAYSDYNIDEIGQQLSGPVLWLPKPVQSDVVYQAVQASCISWNRGEELRQLQQTLSAQVEQQTQGLQQRVAEMTLLQESALSREAWLAECKQELRWLRAYQDLRVLLSSRPLPKATAAAADASPLTLLLVDDAEEIRLLYRQRLERLGYRVVMADSVDTALECALIERPDLALIDFRLPNPNGDQLIARLRGDVRTEHVLPLLLSDTTEADVVAIGAIAQLQKSLSEEVFMQCMALVRDYLQSNKSRWQRGEQCLQARLAVEPEENRRVLLVDDEVENLQLLQRLLNPNIELAQVVELLEVMAGAVEDDAVPAETTAPFLLSSATQGVEAVALARQAQQQGRPFALALIDMRMPPGIDGLETARLLRQISPEVEIVIVTAYSDYTLEQIQQVLGKNFSFLPKPYPVETLRQRVEEGCVKWSAYYQMQRSHNALISLAEDMESEIALRKETERQLEQANRSKDEFLSSMSHELRTPLTTMIGYNEILLEEPGASAPVREMAEISLLAGKTLLQLVNDLLDMSKIRSGKFSLAVGPFSLLKLLHEIKALMQAFARQKRVQLRLEVDEQVEPLLQRQWIGDEMRISQILFNLLSNAIKFSESGAEVELRLATAEVVTPEALYPFMLEVVDRGVGISEEVLPRLFAPFEQADSGISKRFGGTGLGLYICKQLTEMMGGSITVESREGVGSRFTVVLPLQRSEEAVAPAGERADEESAVPRLQGRVLLVEDNLQLQRLGQMLIEKSGAEVVIANNGVEALELGQQELYPLILMDMQMPEMDGVEATRRLREAGVESTIYALTANVMTQHKEQFIAAGGDGFLTKPIQRARLYQLLGSALERERGATPQPQQSGVSAPAAEKPVSGEDLTDLLDEQMMEEFWGYVTGAATELDQAWEAGEWEQLRRIAHAIKAMGTPYGFPQMTALATTLQERALQGDREQLQGLYQQLRALMQRQR